MPDQHPINVVTYLGIDINWRDFLDVQEVTVVPCTHAEGEKWPYCPICGVKQDENHEETIHVGAYRNEAIVQMAETYCWGDPQHWEVDWSEELQVEDYFLQSIDRPRFPGGVTFHHFDDITILGVEIGTITKRSEKPYWGMPVSRILTREGQIAEAAKGLGLSGRPVRLFTVRLQVK